LAGVVLAAAIRVREMSLEECVWQREKGSRLVGRAMAPQLDLSLGSQAKVKKHAKQNEEGKMDFDCLPLTRSVRGVYREVRYAQGSLEGKKRERRT